MKIILSAVLLLLISIPSHCGARKELKRFNRISPVPVASYNEAAPEGTVRLFAYDGSLIGFVLPGADSVSLCRESSDKRLRGCYKDLFIDCGMYLTNRTSLPATESLGLSTEFFSAHENSFLPSYPYGAGDDYDVRKSSNADSASLERFFSERPFQEASFCGDEKDPNGMLLYPDEAPRFSVFYCNGGYSFSHTYSLRAEGRRRLHDFVYNGGSYVGSCAGAFVASRYSASCSVVSDYTIDIYPGVIWHTNIGGSGPDTKYTGIRLEKDCPLEGYEGFKGGDLIEDVRHNYGGSMITSCRPLAGGTEIIGRYECEPGTKAYDVMNGHVGAWAYKENESTGRVVLTGSHPEFPFSDPDGKQLRLMRAFFEYALDGKGAPRVKPLGKGSPYSPEYGIGDRQYHHYSIEIPEGGAEAFSLSVRSNEGLYLAISRDSIAYMSDAQYISCSGNLSIPHLDEGVWHISVFCPVEVRATLEQYLPDCCRYRYDDPKGVLKGIDYILEFDWR